MSTPLKSRVCHLVLVSKRNSIGSNRLNNTSLGPDHANGFLCKHIIFVLHRVLKVSRHSPFLYQHSLTTEELAAIFIHADGQQTDQSVLAEPAVRLKKFSSRKTRFSLRPSPRFVKLSRRKTRHRKRKRKSNKNRFPPATNVRSVSKR